MKDNIKQYVIKIYKENRELQVWDNNDLIETYKIGLGFSPKGNKIREGDGRTPEGVYYICTKNPKSKFTLFLGLSYPNEKDAQRGLKEGWIDESTYLGIKEAITNKKRPNWETLLGGQIGIHGKGSQFDWTAGCIALEDEDIKTLWDRVKLGTEVLIFE